MSANVIIRKQKIKIHAYNENLAFDCRQFVNETLIGELQKMYERIFHQQSQSNDYVIIDSLRIDLGVLSFSEFNNQIVHLTEQKLINELKKQFENNVPQEPGTRYDSDLSPTIQIVAEKDQKQDALLYFFVSGSYPWWYKKNEWEKPSQLLAQFDTIDQWSFFAKLIIKAQSLDEADKEKLVKRLFNHLELSVIENSIYQATHLYSDNSFKSNINALLDQKEQFIPLFNISLEAFYQQVLFFILSHSAESDFFKAFTRRLTITFQVSREDLELRMKALNLDHHFFDTLKRQGAGFETNTTNEPVNGKPGNKIQEGGSSGLIEEGLYIENAGLILLHPFFSAYFRGLDLLNEDDQFKSEESRRRAAVLLSYLESSNEDYKEWEMPLNKVLCGMSITDVIPNDIQLSTHEKEESQMLLHTVVDYWDALRGSSVEAVQNTFILRQGKLAYKDSYWLIQVEPSGVDILLERLPWGIGTIKLPWLQELIYTEW